MRDIVPIADMNTRMPEQGRIRIGKKVPITKRDGTAGTAPKKIPHFRFTSHDEAAIRTIAELYGGEVTRWADGPRDGEWEVFTNAAAIPIVLPPDPLHRVYELWSGGGIQRRCDGTTCMTPQATIDGAELAEVPCICTARESFACKPTTRLRVVLRDVRFGGAWRLESHGWYAAQELPGMVAMLEALQRNGLVSGILLLREHVTVKNGRTNRFMVPALAMDHTVAQIAAGAASLGALAPAPTPALEAPAAPALEQPSPPPVSFDDGAGWAGDADETIDDAELVDEPPVDAVGADTATGEHEDPGGAETASSSSTDDHHAKMLRKMHAVLPHVRAKCDANISIDDWRHALAKTVSRGRTASSGELDDAELAAMLDVLDDLHEGRRRFICIDAMKGTVRMSARAVAS